ncbi:MAG: riboflavin synthase, partial [Gemmataceae bacterium]
RVTAKGVRLGDSIAVNGCCLTVVRQDSTSFDFQVGPESLARTNLGQLCPGDRVNLERSLRLSDRLGGHLVQGHVDGMGTILERKPQEDWEFFWFGCSREWTDQMVTKGSIAVDGVSLTLVDVEEGRFSVALIPHTLNVTTLGFKQAGSSVNLEVDLIAKYVKKLLGNQRPDSSAWPVISQSTQSVND